MNIENQVCTLEQAEMLASLGVIQGETVFCYKEQKEGFGTNLSWVIFHGWPSSGIWAYSAFTVGELGAMLLKETKDCYYHHPSGMWSHHHAKDPDFFPTQAQCYADRLIYLMKAYPVKFSGEFISQRLKKLNNLKQIS